MARKKAVEGFAVLRIYTALISINVNLNFELTLQISY